MGIFCRKWLEKSCLFRRNSVNSFTTALTNSHSYLRDHSGRFRSGGAPNAKAVQVWLKPDVLQRLDTYCAIYGIGRGRAIGHLLKGALPDPSWVPNDLALLGHGDAESAEMGGIDALEECAGDPESDPELDQLRRQPRPAARFRVGDRVSNNSRRRFGVIAPESSQWTEAVRLPGGDLRSGHWSYAVAWDGQMGFTISYAEDLLRSARESRKIC